MPINIDTSTKLGETMLADVLVLSDPGTGIAMRLERRFPELVIGLCTARTAVFRALVSCRPRVIHADAFTTQLGFCLANYVPAGLEWVFLHQPGRRHNLPLDKAYEVTVWDDPLGPGGNGFRAFVNGLQCVTDCAVDR